MQSVPFDHGQHLTCCFCPNGWCSSLWKVKGCSWRFGFFSTFRFSQSHWWWIQNAQLCSVNYPSIHLYDAQMFIQYTFLSSLLALRSLIFLCYPLIEWILCVFPGYNLPGFQITTGPTTVDWRKGWGKYTATVFGIYHFIFSSSFKGCWHSAWAACLYFKLSWSLLTVDQAFISGVHWYFCSIAGKQLELLQDPYKITDCSRHNTVALTLIPSGKRFYLPRIKMKTDK